MFKKNQFFLVSIFSVHKIEVENLTESGIVVGQNLEAEYK